MLFYENISCFYVNKDARIFLSIIVRIVLLKLNYLTPSPTDESNRGLKMPGVTFEISPIILKRIDFGGRTFSRGRIFGLSFVVWGREADCRSVFGQSGQNCFALRRIVARRVDAVKE